MPLDDASSSPAPDTVDRHKQPSTQGGRRVSGSPGHRRGESTGPAIGSGHHQHVLEPYAMGELGSALEL